MENPATVLHFGLVGIGATMVMDCWAFMLWKFMRISALDYALVGRWVCHLCARKCPVTPISQAQPFRNERVIGWVVHYATGIMLALIFGQWVGQGWLSAPKFFDAFAFGGLTVVLPFFLMQPAFGAGIAASKTPQPTIMRLKSLNAHFSFGLGLFITAKILQQLT